ncbi:YD repeat protein [Denitrovibrio acetiphilus DSM 12809]|uniref:YD repeat protein n=1 Tax=Denitrovibrio acetiphilus (strain DSM 12809 / NBRC 114555 / N2460) TaxID=522772 RepID=D4H805_DENA2|nr:RHS repeat-associated core domain-containing protein [Denitrovibrio acetiphilus]ADD68154.1 YD repeat protein [Denitrovibrio acetiphilus DSM 12809]
MSNSTKSRIPQIRPSQFEDSINNVFNKSVNLFRGDVNLAFDLVSLKGRNGLNAKATAIYGSNIKGDINRSNASSPTGILGLGWYLPFDRIEVRDRDNASINDNQYYLYTDNTSVELVATANRWTRTTLSKNNIEDLNQSKISESFVSEFIEAGLILNINSDVEVILKDQEWQISDAVNQRSFSITNEPDNLSVSPAGLVFEAFQYDFSHIVYYKQYERWEIVKDNGTSYFYGGNDDPANNIQWKVRWGNWSGKSALAKSSDGNKLQTRYPVAWNLVAVEDIWGDTISFMYETVEQQVGKDGLCFTKSCYLSKITDMLKRTICFNYGEKEYNIDSLSGAREYLAPNWDSPYTKVPDNSPSAYQDKYETRYLDNITVNNPQNVMLYKIQLSYTLSNFSSYKDDNPLYGDTVKRTLTGIQRVFADNCSSPGLIMAYSPYGSVNPGALCSAVTPNGAKIDYKYKQQSLPLCNRQYKISNPWPKSAKPRVWFGGDYTVNLWLNESTDQINVALYTWVGSWQKWEPETQNIDAAFSIDSVNVVTAEDFTCLSYSTPQSVKSYIHVYHKDNCQWGKWLQTPPITINSTNMQLAAGDNFFVICDQDNRVLKRYTWNCFNKSWIVEDISSDLKNSSPNSKPYLTATGKHYALLDYASESGGAHNNQLALYYQDNLYQWHHGGTKEMKFTIGGYNPDNSFGFYTSGSFIALTYITKEVSLSFDYTVKIISWDETFGSVTEKDFSYKLPKSNPSGVITIPFIAKFVNNSMIVSGPNLLRYNGEQWLQNSGLDFRDTCSDKDINWFAYGDDYAIATSNREYAVESRLVAFDANTDVTDWNSKGVPLYSKNDPTSDRKRHYFPTAGADIATMGNRIYHRGSQCSWENAVSDYQEVPYDIDSTSMINQGPRFISYLNIDGDTAKNTTELPLLNQFLGEQYTLNQRYFTQINADGSIRSNINGQFPSGLSTFVTYLPLDKDFNSADTITLNRYLDNTLQGDMTDYCVDSISIDNGYTATTTKFIFDINTASCDPTGAVFKYYKSTYYPGTDDVSSPRFGYTEQLYYNGIADQSGAYTFETDNQSSVLMDGQQVEQKIFDADGRLLHHEQQQLNTFTNISVAGKSYNLFGGYTRCVQNTSTKDGLVVRTLYQYDSRFGKLTQECFDNVTRNNTVETVYKSYQYAFQAYPWFIGKNIIDLPLSQFDSISNADGNEARTITSGSLQQYKPYERQDPESGTPAPTVWAGSESYVLQQEVNSSELHAGNLAKAAPGQQWQLVNTVLDRTFYGVITSQKDITKQIETTIWDKNQLMPVATFNNPGLNTCDFIGFEPYEDCQGWQLSGSKAKLSDNIIYGDAYTGSSCFQLKAQNKLEKTAALQQLETVIVSGWIKASQGFLKESGNVYLETGSDNPEKIAIIPAGEEKWLYWQAVIKKSSSNEQSLSVSITNEKNSGYLLINNIFIVPLACEMEAKFYDPVYSDEIASIGSNADTKRYAYDSMRQKFAEIGPQENTKKGSISYNTREWQDLSPYQYPQDTPSSDLEIIAADGGIYETFTSGEQTWNTWQRDQNKSWAIKNGQLCHAGSNKNTIKWLSTANTGTYAIGLTISSPDSAGTAFSLGIGDKLNASWDIKNGWKIVLNGTTHTDKTVNGKVPVNVMLMPLNGAVLLFAGGRQVFSVINDTQIKGVFTLSAKGNIQFSNPVTFLAPQVSVNYKNGDGQKIQSQVLNNTKCLVKNVLYDSMYNIIAETKIAGFDNTLFGYRKSFVKGFDSSTGVMIGEVSDYYPEDEGYPYSGTIYEASPLARPLKKGLPGKDFAITGDNKHNIQFCYNVTDQQSVAGISYHAGDFLVTSTTNANNTTVYTIYDRKGQTLGKQTNDGNGMLDAVQQVFDSAGNIIQILHPNYFTNSASADSFVTQNTYNFLGQLESRITPDVGETKYIYDQVGRIRFSTTAETTKKGTVLYKKYDAMGRITEEGEMVCKWGDGTQLQVIADSDPLYPQSHNWETLNSYDGTGEDITLQGRLWKTEKRSADNVIIENTYGYDNCGKANECILTIPNQKQQISRYTYNNLGNIIAIDYPDGAQVPRVCYTYNDMGQNIAIGTKDEPEKFASYRYNADGSLADEKLNCTGEKPLLRQMSYNSPGWITDINNSYADQKQILEHKFSYTAGGYKGAGYFNGNIAKVTNTDSITPENSFEYLFQYDSKGQLTVAQHTTNPAYSIGTGAPLSFDAAGNILTLQQGELLRDYSYQQGSNKLTAVKTGDSVQSFNYDKSGNITGTSDINLISYNMLNNLPFKVSNTDGSELTFAYNGINQRVIKRKTDGTQTLYVHGFSDCPIMEITNETKQYIYGVGGLTAMINDDGAHYVLKDHQGSVRMVISEKGNVETTLNYMPFGQLIADSSNNADFISYRYTGQEFDTELMLYNYRARFYDPNIGRFYSCDPKFQYNSPFVYSGNNPVNLTDPSGDELATFTVILLIGLAVGAVLGAGAATYTGIKAGLTGGKLAGYIFAGAAVGAAAGALSAAGGVGAFAAGSAAAAAATTTAGGIAAGVAAGAGVGATVGLAVGATQGVSQHFINDAFGVENSGTWQQSLLSGAITGAIGGAIAGGMAGAGGAMATQQAARYLEITGRNGWAYSPNSLSQVSNAYSSFGSMGVIPLPSFVSRIPNVNIPLAGGLQTLVLGKFSLPTIATVVGALAKQAVSPLLPSSGSSSGNVQSQSPDPMLTYYGQRAYNPSMSGSIGMEASLVMNPAMWNNSQE